MTEAPQLTESLVTSIPDAIVVADGNGQNEYSLEPQERGIFGFTSAEAVGQSLDLMIPERLRERHWTGYRRVMAGAPSRYGEGDLLAVPAIRSDGSTISESSSRLPFRTRG